MTDEILDALPEQFARVVEPSAEPFKRLVAVIARLRAPGGCPWDQKQTHESLARHLLEESYEVLEAIDSNDTANLREELGDLLLQVVLHAQLASESGDFTIADLTTDLREKLIHRHPHVFGDTTAADADEVLVNWEKSKRAAKGTRVMDGVPAAMPALARATKLSRRAAQLGLQHPDNQADVGAINVAAQNFAGRDPEAAIGKLLWDVATFARTLDIEPETALRKATESFAQTFTAAEDQIIADGLEPESLSDAQWRQYWERAMKGDQ